MKRLIIVTMAMLYFGLAFGKMGEELADPFYFKCPLNITNIDSQDPTDCNINNGVIEIEVTGGNGSYEYSVNDGASWQSSNRFQDLPAGTFLIKVRQTDGACESSGSEVVNLQGPDSPRFIAVNSTPPTDCGLADGTITIEARGGTGPYGYSIDGGETWVAAKFFQSLAAGTYRAMVRNADGTCETPYIFPIELIGPTPPEISGVDFSPITDCDREDASIRIQTENSGDFLYSIDGRASWQQEAAFNDLAAGRFDIWVSNSNGSCPINYGPVTIPALEPPSIEGVLVNPTSDCGQQDASIQVIADGSYEYQLEQGNWQTSSEFPALSAGNYTIKVRNVDGTCLQILPEEVIDARVAPEIREVSFQPPSDCGLSDGQIEVEASAGDGAISYSFDGGASWGSIAVASNLPSGTYEVRLRNENGSCVQTYPLIELEGPTPPVIANIVDIAPSSCNGTNGFIAIQTEETGLEYSIDGGQTWGGGNQFANLRAGNYQPMVRRTTGNCESTGRLIQLEDPPTPALLGVETSNPSDCSLNDGVIFVQASSSIPLEYSIDGGSTWSSNPRFQNLAGGRFLVQVRNGNQSCSVAGPLINLTAPTAPEVELSLAGPSSCGGADGRIDLASLSGEPLEYSLNNGQSWQTQASFNGLTEGAYVLRFRKLDGTCEQQYPLSIELNPPALPAFEIFADSPTDCGSSDGLVWVEVQGNPDMEYSLDGGLTFQESPRFPNLTSDIYDLVLRDKTTNCRTEFAEEVRLIGPTLPPLEVEIRHPSICDGRDGLILAGPVDGGQGRYQYSINGGQSWSNYGAFPNLRPGVYQIMARNADGSCVRSWSEEAVLEEAPLPDFSVETIQPIVCDEANGEIQIILSNEEEDIEFSLDGGESWQEQAKFEQLRQGNYQLLLRIAGRPCEFGGQEIVLNNAIQPLEPELLIAQPTACGEPNGRISLGEVPINDTWEYSINGGVDWTRNPAWNNLVVGTYQFHSRNLQYPCLATTERIISLTTTESPSILAVDIQQAADCEVGGSIRFQLEGEETDYLYSIDGGINWQASPLFDSLSVGQYQLSVQDMEGQCQAIYQGNSEIKHPILAQVAGVETIPPAACGSTDGEIHILLAEETNNLSFSIDGGISWQPEPSFQALAAGIYEVLVQGEELDCAPIPLQFDLAITIDPLDVEIEATPVSDCQQEDGRIEIVFDAAADVSFRLADGDWQDQPVFENLGANVYAIEIRNNENECIALLNGTFDLAPADLSAPEADWENPSFCGAVDGSIRITVDDEAPLEFSIDGGNTWQLEHNFTGLGADSYQVQVRRLGSQCQPERYPGLITLHDDERIPELEALLTPPTDCITEDGSIRINSAAENGLSFSLNGGAWTTEANYEGLAQGTFTLAIRYAQGSCQLSQSETYTLEANEELPEPDLTVEAISDCGTVDGRISFEELSDNLQYSIDGGLSWQTSPTFSRLPAGNYLPRIQSEDGACTNLDMAPIVVPNPTPIPLARINSRDPSACLQADGHIEFELSSPSADYRYSIDNGETWQRSPSFEDLGPGRYQPVVRRINSDCELQSFWVDLELIEIPTIQEVKVSPASNCSANDGRIEITASGNGPISYSIDAGQTWSTSPIFDELVSTNYIVAVMVEGACPNFYQESVRVGKLENLSVKLVEQLEPSCAELDDAVLTVQASGGVGPYEYRWSNGGDSPENGDLTAGTYQVTVTDGRSCEAVRTYQVQAPEPIEVSLGPDLETTLCLGQSLNYDFEPEGYSYEWEGDNGFQSTAAQVVLNQAGTYHLTVTDENGCTATDQVELSYRDEFFVPDFLLPRVGLIETPIVAIDISWPIPDEIRWEYDPTEVVHQETYFNQEIVSFPQTGAYNIRLYAKKGECEGVLDKTITIYNDPDSLLNQGLGGDLVDHVLDFSLYPNPNQGMFDVRVQLDDMQDIKLWVFDDDGTLIESRDRGGALFYLEEFELPGLQTGLYTLVLQTENQWYYLSFVVSE